MAGVIPFQAPKFLTIFFPLEWAEAVTLPGHPCPCWQPKYSLTTSNEVTYRAPEMARWLRGFTVLAEDLSSVPIIPIRHLTTVCNVSSRGICHFLATMGTCTHLVLLNSYRHTHIHINKSSFSKKKKMCYSPLRTDRRCRRGLDAAVSHIGMEPLVQGGKH